MGRTSTAGVPEAAPALTMSIVISTYNRPIDLDRAVRSLWNQRRLPDQIVVVCWRGDVATSEVAASLAQASPSVCIFTHIVSDVNTVTAKENVGISAATGDIVCFMDDDAAAHPEWLWRLGDYYKDPTVGAVGGRDIVQRDGRQIGRLARRVGRVSWFGRLTGNHHEVTSGVREVDFLKGCNMSFRRELLPSIDPRLVGEIPYGFEIDLGLSVRDRGFRVIFDPETAVDHYASTDMSAHLPALAYITNHNQTYVLMKHFTPIKRCVFVLYTFLIGDKNTIGLARVPILVLLQRWGPQSIRAHFAGKIAGLRSYLEQSRAAERLGCT